MAWGKNVVNNIVGGLLVDKDSIVYLVSKVPRGDNVKVHWVDPITLDYKVKTVQVKTLEKHFSIAVRGQPSLSSARVCPHAAIYFIKNQVGPSDRSPRGRPVRPASKSAPLWRATVIRPSTSASGACSSSDDDMIFVGRHMGTRALAARPRAVVGRE